MKGDTVYKNHNSLLHKLLPLLYLYFVKSITLTLLEISTCSPYPFGEGGGPSLTDVLVVLYLHLTECSMNIPRELNFPRREGEPKFFRHFGVSVGVGVEILILIPKETYNTCNFS